MLCSYHSFPCSMYFPLTIIITCCYFIQNGNKPVDSGPIYQLYYFCAPLTLSLEPMETLVSHTTLLTVYQRQNNQLQTKALGSINTHSAHTLGFRKMRTHQLPCIFYVSRAGETAQLIKVLNEQG